MLQAPRSSHVILLDGALGTVLQRQGLAPGEVPERLNLTAPERVEAVHRAYVDSGAQILYTNTFGANPKKLPPDLDTETVVTAAVAIARRATGTRAKVALDVGPIGELIEPSGPLTFDEAYEFFRRMAVCGEREGVDLVALETMSDLAEVRAALLAVRENTALPVLCTMTFEESGRTFTGCDARSFAVTAEALGACAVGVNCSLGPSGLLPVLREIAAVTTLPLAVKPNAGLPGPDGSYSLSAAEFAGACEGFLELGVTYLGGCCGTTPETVAALADLCARHAAAAISPNEPSADAPNRAEARALASKGAARRAPDALYLCSATRFLSVDGVKVIGERINPTGKPRLKEALKSGDTEYIDRQALDQLAAGAELLDVNVGLPGLDEAAVLERVVKSLQAACDAPLVLDSSDPAALAAGLRAFHGLAVVNSVNGDDEVLESILPIAAKYGAAVIGLALDRQGIPKTSEQRLRIVDKIVSKAQSYGVPPSRVLIDCLTLTVSAEQDQVGETLAALRAVKQRGLRTTLGVSNISFGLPQRQMINSAFLCLALGAGLDLPITNPNVPANMDAVRAYRALSGEDRGCAAYVDHYANLPAPGAAPAPASAPAPAPASAAPSPSPTPPAGPAHMAPPPCPTPPAGPVPHAPASVESSPAPAHDSAAPTARAPAAPANELTLGEAILRGLPAETAALTRRLLERETPLDVVNGHLIPALDLVGRRYESGKIFLPQLIRAAETAKLGFAEVKNALAGADVPEKGKIVLATVKGDIHDIGKNIVKVVLENYGYRVIDLGKNVEIDAVVDAVRREDARLVGLSALMTTTVAAMKQTIAALRAARLDCKVMVGGAVLTEDYAREIGADYYAKDANQSVRIAREVLG